ncbi:glycerol-3-phosphate acyltransferase [Sulfitobacter sp. M57]|uniref:1-acyl-sn-glycerol-3-phosphate acyltransferase n=1 Tax=unclassified Sulfitobacter TaxID=196795 RepID=UPI0023E179A9|nr:MULTISPECIES: 1-acyl-sn-glycerol-3-phosphate acyltransferase [unclassified Sulfitobacter]MDF3412880.1 glycerol-3-phosphate acyltransferase [Sulfitobacter sp. KE5]MDF3421836.1 glycerol-3-phosphate acyltransferase [Sulfitobacter sp. KE43]MDF3431429.1 glycerol-3-phosphate acyltransferase [Sulfitobacter sp. KE42]MDF3457070.1 glycerol-3-phosphate acyltransferase [Sulfitobacter sp. S74]MDF3460973.1 glycerol-3-phosphate acyltransferase [Sulfitobacter sp. Ks18]
MTQTVQLPLWLFVLIMLFAAVTALSHFLLPSVRWFFRRRLEKAVKRLNKRLKRPIEPFKLARRYDMIQRLIYDPEVTREIVNYARQNGVPENVAFEKARDYAREIVPSFSAFAYFSFAIRLARLLANFVYRIERSETNDRIFSSIPKDATVVFVMNHRSNMDYVLVTYLAARDSALSYAVGEWARVWPLSWLIKSLGAYFIRRRSRGALYRKVLARYVQMATEGGVNQAFYPEGGLSLTGKLQPPKMGLMSYLVEGFDPQGARDVVFVPVAINYDRVLEDVVLIAAHERGDRRFGARISVVVRFVLRKLWQRLTFQETRFGRAVVAFGTPLSLRAAGSTVQVETLSAELMDQIAGVMPVLAVPAVCHVLLKQDGIEDAGLRGQAAALFDIVPEGNRGLDVPDRALEVSRAIEGVAKRGLIEQRNGYWYVVAGKEAVLTFYANSIAHFFEGDAAGA